MNEAEEVLVGRCYTKARRHRHVIGQWDGHRLIGGPYTVPQFVTMAVVLGLMVLTRGLWARFGLLDVVPLIAVPYASSFVVRQLHIDGRSPFAAAASAIGLAAAAKGGRLGGRPLPRRRPHLLLGSSTLTWRTRPGGPVRTAPAVVGGGVALSNAAALLAARRVAIAQQRG
ncbi:hypothetical protein [Streptomyces odonnellii]|uniref:hypothetical protein n=1 Tax=Streptomyces odonnellii TaxID=1417980 RepID=UPI000625A89C|nr:hypothetical protein [Streptomyces odonnellii]